MERVTTLRADTSPDHRRASIVQVAQEARSGPKRNQNPLLDTKNHMRSSKSRSRGNKNRQIRPSGGNIINRVFDSSGPDGKVRGTPQQIIEKYTQLHRDAQLSNDRVNAENFSQHAEHYTRMLAEAMREVDRAREEQEQFNRDRQAERDRQMERQNNNNGNNNGNNGNQPDRDRQAERERQSERDRERAARLRAQEEIAADPGMSPQPDLIGMIDDAETPSDSGLVETPEARARAARPERRERPARPDRGPRHTATDPDAAEAAPLRFESPAAIVAQLQDAPAPAEDKPRAPRPRKPRAKPAAAAEGPAEAAE